VFASHGPASTLIRENLVNKNRHHGRRPRRCSRIQQGISFPRIPSIEKRLHALALSKLVLLVIDEEAEQSVVAPRAELDVRPEPFQPRQQIRLEEQDASNASPFQETVTRNGEGVVRTQSRTPLIVIGDLHDDALNLLPVLPRGGDEDVTIFRQIEDEAHTLLVGTRRGKRRVAVRPRNESSPALRGPTLEPFPERG